MSWWMIDATIRTAWRVDESTAAAVTGTLSTRGGLARGSGARGLCVRFGVQADTHAEAYGAALFVLATDVLLLVEGADLTDLHVTATCAVPEYLDGPLSA